VRCSEPRRLARLAFDDEAVVEARIQDDGQGVLVRTREADRFYDLLNRAVAAGEIELEAVAPADDNVGSVYQYLLGNESAGSM
jgi:ABC-2 type transport system ATP-binding protein